MQSFGDPQAAALRWPLNRSEAPGLPGCIHRHGAAALWRLRDALAAQAPRLFHSLLSFALNGKMLHRLEVVQRRQAAMARRAGPKAPLAPSVEGICAPDRRLAQYVRGIYWANMPGYDAQRPASRPAAALVSGTARRIRCLHLAITQSLQTAHAHHIQRLMVIGNFALLAGLEPQALHRWYLGIYIDAFEWVELPNTLGMSQRADGGVIATKPLCEQRRHICSARATTGGLRLRPKAKTGARACPSTPCTGTFERHAPTLQGNHHAPGAGVPPAAKCRRAARGALRTQAGHLRERLDAGRHGLQRPKGLSMQSLPAGYRALVLDAPSGAIGGALAAQLRDDPYCAKMLAGRSTTPAVDFDAHRQHCRGGALVFTQGPWNLVLVATGMLQTMHPTGKPESV